MNEELPEGYSVPVYRALLRPVFFGGVPKSVGISLGMVAALVAAALLIKPRLDSLVAALFAELAILGSYRFAAERCKRDPHYFEVALQNRGPRQLVP